MNTESFDYENTFKELRTSSRVSLIMMIVGGLVLVASVVYSATRLSPLEAEISKKRKLLVSAEKSIESLKNESAELSNLVENLKTKVKSLEVSEDLVENGVESYLSKNYSLAVDEYSKAIDLNPQHQSAYGLRGQAYVRLKDYQKALSDLNKALSINPSNNQALYSIAITLFSLQKNHEAATMLSKYLDIVPEELSTIRYGGDFSPFRERVEFKNVIKAERDKVSFVQEKLKKLGFYNSSVDGLPGERTQEAILNFQRSVGIAETGVWDKKTRKLLNLK